MPPFLPDTLLFLPSKERLDRINAMEMYLKPLLLVHELETLFEVCAEYNAQEPDPEFHIFSVKLYEDGDGCDNFIAKAENGGWLDHACDSLHGCVRMDILNQYTVVLSEGVAGTLKKHQAGAVLSQYEAEILKSQIPTPAIPRDKPRM